MTYKNITNNPRIDNVELSKAGLGFSLDYELDGVPANVTGEFYIDKDSILHHDALDKDGNEVEILVQLEF